MLTTKSVDEFKEQDNKYPVKICNILDDFSNLWTVELPNQLPHLRNIQLTTSLLMTHIILRTINLFYNTQKSFKIWYLSA